MEARHFVNLVKTGDKKIQVIKVMRAATGLGLKEAKHLVDQINPDGISVAMSDFPNRGDLSGLVMEFIDVGADANWSYEPEYKVVLLDKQLKDHLERQRRMDLELKEQQMDQDSDEIVPFTIDQLALKLAMLKMDAVQVLTLALALHGIEDASGSLREVANRMKEVSK